ncbi:hypothetical protein Tco_1021343 [Tanacetum coccineum]
MRRAARCLKAHIEENSSKGSYSAQDEGGSTLRLNLYQFSTSRDQDLAWWSEGECARESVEPGARGARGGRGARSAYGLFIAEKKIKRSLEIIQDVFMKENIVMNGIQRNLIPPSWVKGSRGLLIREPKSGIFFYNGNFDLVFQREEEFHLATTTPADKFKKFNSEDL